MNKVRFAFCVAGLTVIGTNAGTTTLDLVGVVIFVLLFSKIFTEFVDFDREGNALVKKFFLGHGIKRFEI